MKVSQSKPLESLLLDILDSTQLLEKEIASENLDFDLLKDLVSKRGNKLAEFTSLYASVSSNKSLDNKYFETFTKIYSQIINKQGYLVDTIDRKLSTISKELSGIRKERKIRSSYTVNQYAEQPNNSILITSKIQG